MTALFLATLLFQTSPSCCAPSMSAFASDPAFAAAHLAPLPFRFVPTDGKMLIYDDAAGEPTTGFVIKPNDGVTSSVVLVHEYWGLNDYIKQAAEQLHKDTGYGVLAVDLYEGKVATDSATAVKYMGAVDAKRATNVVKGAVVALKSGTFGFKSEKIGTLGFCFGGGWSHQAAIQGGKDVQACVIYYGLPDTKPASLEKLQAPVLMIWGDQDAWINQKVVDDFKAAMDMAQKPLTTLSYHANHAFANPSNPKYDKASGEAAMAETLKFFKKYLG